MLFSKSKITAAIAVSVVATNVMAGKHHHRGHKKQCVIDEAKVVDCEKKTEGCCGCDNETECSEEMIVDEYILPNTVSTQCDGTQTTGMQADSAASPFLALNVEGAAGDDSTGKCSGTNTTCATMKTDTDCERLAKAFPEYHCKWTPKADSDPEAAMCNPADKDAVKGWVLYDDLGRQWSLDCEYEPKTEMTVNADGSTTAHVKENQKYRWTQCGNYSVEKGTTAPTKGCETSTGCYSLTGTVGHFGTCAGKDKKCAAKDAQAGSAACAAADKSCTWTEPQFPVDGKNGGTYEKGVCFSNYADWDYTDYNYQIDFEHRRLDEKDTAASRMVHSVHDKVDYYVLPGDMKLPDAYQCSNGDWAWQTDILNPDEPKKSDQYCYWRCCTPMPQSARTLVEGGSWVGDADCDASLTSYNCKEINPKKTSD